MLFVGHSSRYAMRYLQGNGDEVLPSATTITPLEFVRESATPFGLVPARGSFLRTSDEIRSGVDLAPRPQYGARACAPKRYPRKLIAGSRNTRNDYFRFEEAGGFIWGQCSFGPAISLTISKKSYSDALAA